MSLAEESAAFAQTVQRATNVNALGALVETTIRRLGFDHYALIHHVSIYRAGGGTVFLHNYPEEWAATVHVRGYLHDDPLAEVCRRQRAPFAWSDMEAIIGLSKRQREIMREAKKAGLAHGCTIPVHRPGEPIGSCSFSTARSLPPDAIAALKQIGVVAFEAARRLVRRGASVSPRLTPREHDCLLLIGRGLSDLEASRILAISEATVTQHVETARRRFGVASRVELIVRALYRSELCFDELLEVEGELAGLKLMRRGSAAADDPAPMTRLGALFFGDNPELN